MLRLRAFEAADAALLSSEKNVRPEETAKWIDEWKAKRFNGMYFEMFAIEADGRVVGMISLYAHSQSVISVGPEIFEEYRQKGFAKVAMTEAIRIAKEKNYRIILQQVRTTNAASQKLHESLGFERDICAYKNRHGNDIFLYLKTI